MTGVTASWERRPVVDTCGFCSARIPVGAPMRVTRHAEHRWRKVRCEQCAGEPVPADLPELEPRTIVPMHATKKPKPTWTRSSDLARQFDRKAAQTGERE